MTTKEKLDAHDRQIAAIRTLLQQGMKMLVEYERENREEHVKIRRELRELTSSVQTLVNSLKRGGNGHAKGKVDVQ